MDDANFRTLPHRHKHAPIAWARLCIQFATIYIMRVYHWVALLVCVLFVPSVYAFEAIEETVPTQYEVITIQNPEIEQLLLGELTDAPEMFEIVSETPFTLTAEIRAVPNTSGTSLPQLGGIIIRQKEIRGVEEVARLNATDATWAVMTDPDSGLVYQAGPYFSEPVEAGTYRIEVSNPNNQGKYLLVIGNQKDANGYFASLSDIKLVYRFYGLSMFRMVSSPYVYYPLGFVLLVGIIFSIWYWRRSQKHHA